MKNILFLLMLSLCCAISSSAQRIIPMDSAVRYGKLDNGLTYYIRHNDTKKKRADFYIVQNVGSILEEDKQNGLAHFLEHMAFNGTKNFPNKSLINYMESIGAKFGSNVNASTSLDETVYKLTDIPVTRTGIIDSSILILHDWSGFISLNDEEIDKERGVVLEEWRIKANAGRRMRNESRELKYLGSQYAKRNGIGDTAVIKSFKHEDLREFYKKWYRPDLQALIIVGDVNVDSIEQSIKRMFADIPKPLNPAERIVYTIPDNTEPIVSIVTDAEAKVSTFSILYKHEPLADSIKATEEAVNISLTNGLISSIINDRFSQLNSKQSSPLMNSLASYGSLTRSCDAFTLSARAKEGKEKIAFQQLIEEIERIKRYGFLQTELDRAIAKRRASLEKAHNNQESRKNFSYANRYAQHFLEKKAIPSSESEYTYAITALNENVSLEKINNAAQSYFTNTNIIVDISASKKDEQALPTKDEVFRALADAKSLKVEPYTEKVLDELLLKKVPKSGTIVREEDGAIFKTTQWQLSNGIRVIFRPTKKGEVRLTAFSNGGLSMIKKVEDLPTASLATTIISNNGLGDFNRLDLDRLLVGKDVKVKASITPYAEEISGSSSINDLETLFKLTYLTFTAPRKDDDAYANYIDKLKTALANADKDPRKVFNDSVAMVESGYGPRTVLQNLEMVNSIDQNKAYKIYKQRFGNPADFTFVIMGPLDMDSIKPFVLTYLGGMKTSSKRETWKDNNIRHPKGQITKSFERSMQVEKTSVKLFYWAEMPYTLNNELALKTLANILDIRCTESIRENEGGSYSIHVNAGATNKPINKVTLSISFDTNKEMAEKLIGIAQAELDKIQKEGVRADDLDKVKKNLLKRYEEDKKSKGFLLEAIKRYEQDGINLKTDYSTTVDGLTPESIRQTLKALLVQGNRIEFKMSQKAK